MTGNSVGNILELRNEDSILKGLLDGRRAFCGPEIVQFDITNRCNNNCLCCWNNSPLLGKLNRKEERKKQQELPANLIKKVIDELSQLGTHTLFFAGGGEPFMHPDIMEILKYAKQHNMRTIINTNFTLLDEEKIYDLVDLKINFIHVSLLAGTAKTYSAIHPNKTEDDFYRIKNALMLLARLKDIKKTWVPLPYPHINMYYVIFNKNYHEIESMVDLALELRANSIEFVPVDVIPKKTDILLLDKEQIKIAKDKIKEQVERLRRMEESCITQVPFIQNADLFIKRISSENAHKGEYETHTVSKRPCYVGWAFARILADGNVNPCLKAHRISIGNIYQTSFERIWNSRRQKKFRINTLKLSPRNRYFRKIGNTSNGRFGCLKSCDNIEINFEMHERFKGLLNFKE